MPHTALTCISTGICLKSWETLVSSVAGHWASLPRYGTCELGLPCAPAKDKGKGG